jgi:hypothetical protein
MIHGIKTGVQHTIRMRKQAMSSSKSRLRPPHCVHHSVQLDQVCLLPQPCVLPHLLQRPSRSFASLLLVRQKHFAEHYQSHPYCSKCVSVTLSGIQRKGFYPGAIRKSKHVLIRPCDKATRRSTLKRLLKRLMARLVYLALDLELESEA